LSRRGSLHRVQDFHPGFDQLRNKQDRGHVVLQQAVLPLQQLLLVKSFLSSRVMAAGLYKQGIPNSPVTRWTHNVFTILRASTLSVFFHESLMM